MGTVGVSEASTDESEFVLHTRKEAAAFSVAVGSRRQLT
jgi:hypothetical protein